MANAITPFITGNFDGELVWTSTDLVVDESLKNYIENMEIVYRDNFTTNSTGFEKFKHKINSSSGTDIFIDISIQLVGSLPIWLMRQLTQLVKGVCGSGMQLYLKDNWWSDYQYTCRLLNAGDFVENSTLLCGGRLMFGAWERQSL